MNTRFLETFVTLAELESFRATARALHATPAAVSLRIRSLENELGAVLVDRSVSHFGLTPAGRNLLALARNVVTAERELREAAMRGTEIGGRLRLGVIETVVHSWLSSYIRQLSRQYPHIDVDLTVDSSSVLRHRLLCGELDLVIRVDGIDSPKIASSAIASYPVRWIARRGLFSSRTRVFGARLLRCPILTFERGTAPQIALESIVQAEASRAGVRADELCITCSPSVAAIVQLVRDGYGIAGIPGVFVSNELQAGEFIELPLKPALPPINVSLCKPAAPDTMVSAAAAVAHGACLAWCRATSRDLVQGFS